MEQFRQYSEKFLQITAREQYLITFSGLAVIILMMFNLFIDTSLSNITRHQKVIKDSVASIKASSQSIEIIAEAIAHDPNKAINERIAQLEHNLGDVDKDLLKLTSDLIDPVQMRFALMDLLNLQQGVNLVSFQVKPAQPLLLAEPIASKNEDGNIATDEKIKPSVVGLYKHSIKIKLSGDFFKLRDYLHQLEQMSWTFFWQDFEYKLKEYPVSELEVTLYTLSTKREFIGV